MMTEQLQNLALDSAADFIDLLIQPAVRFVTYSLIVISLFSF